MTFSLSLPVLVLAHLAPLSAHQSTLAQPAGVRDAVELTAWTE